MRKYFLVTALIAIWLVAVGCEITIPDVVVSTIVSEGQAVATEVAKALTETAVAGGAPAVTLPSGGGPEATIAPEPSVTHTIMPTAALPHLRVAFVHNGSPWLVEPQAAPYPLSQLTGVDSVDISDDGQMVAYIRHDSFDQPGELRVVNYNATGDRSLLTSAQVGALEPLPAGASNVDLYQVKWIPGSHNLLVSTQVHYMGPGLGRSDDLFLVNAETGALSVIFAAGTGGEVWPSPDGTKMAISRSSYVSLCNIDGSGMHASVFTFTDIITYSEYSYYPPVVWSPDSTHFGVIIASSDPLAPATTGSIWTVDAATGAATLQSTLNGTFFLPVGVLSPTLAKVGYIVKTAVPNVEDSYVSNLDGSSALHLATGNTAVESFSPDGQYFVYHIGGPTTKYAGSLGGGTVLIPGSVMRLQWFNNTRFVYAMGTIVGGWTLQIGDTAGGSALIADPNGNNTNFDADE